jgi:hypothetical protein
MLDLAAIELKKSFEHEGCPLCHLRRKDEAHYIHGVLYEYVNDAQVRDSFVASLGYCRDHAWQQQKMEMERCKDVLGTATMYQSVLHQNMLGLEKFIASLDTGDTGTGWLSRLGGRLRSAHPSGSNHPSKEQKTNLPFGLALRKRCRVCRVSDESQQRTLHTFVDTIEQEEFIAAYRNSGGLCLPHLSALNHARDGAHSGVRKLLIRLTLEKLEEKARSLRSLLRNYYRRCHNKPFYSLGTRTCQSAIEQFTGDLKWHPCSDPLGHRLSANGISDSDPCPVCAVLKKAGGDRMRSFLDESGSTSALREEMVASQGFCGRHARRMFHLGKAPSAGAGVAALYLELIERTITALQCELYSLPRHAPAIRGRVKFARPQRNNCTVPAEACVSQLNQRAACPICRFETDAEYQAMVGFVLQLDDPAFRESYIATDGLCLPHLRMALGEADMEGKVFLAKTAHNMVASLLHLVREYTRKHNWHFRDETKFPEEQEAIIRTIRFQVGQPDCL